MKALILTAILAITLVSCNQKNKETENNTTETSANSSELYACPMHPEVQGKKDETCSKCGMELTELVTQTQAPHEKKATEASSAATTQSNVNIEDILISYINLKNKLVKDDTNGAAEKAKILFTSFDRFDIKVLSEKQKKEYLDIADDAKEHAEHIGDNGGKIEHQREHFVMLSKDMNDLIQLFGTSQKLYLDFCPMADDNKGAVWISETKEIKNTYFGKEMATCGSIKKEY